MDAISMLARGIKAGETELGIAGGVEGMSRAPVVMPKSDRAFGRSNHVYDTTIGWRFISPAMQKQYGVDSMPETADNVAKVHEVGSADQDPFALTSQAK